MSAKLVSIVAAASMLAVSVPAFASVETRSSDAIPAAHAPNAHARFADEKKPARAGRAARGGTEGAGGGGLGVSTGVLAGLAGILGAIGIAVAVQNRSN